MKKFYKFVWMLAVLFTAGGAMASCASADTVGSNGTWRYKMTVAVETPEGIKTGSAVREVHVSTFLRLSPSSLPTVSLKGEAVVVDLGARGVLFALLSGYWKGSDYGADIPAIVYNPEQAYMSAKGIEYMSHLKAGPTELEPKWYPKFVRFRDINDPKTVENLLDMETCPGGDRYSYCIKQDHFAEAFGEGVKLKSVTIEMTDEPVTWVIDTWLPWLPNYYNKRLDGDRFGSADAVYKFANRLSSGSFSTGVKK